jgi:toxin ParE1/3/4
MARGSHKLLWSPTAERDLAEIWTYLNQNASRELANAQTRRIYDRCAALRRRPLTGRARNDLLPGVRQVLVNPYIIFYRIRTDSVEIMHVLHGRRDLAALFKKEP